MAGAETVGVLTPLDGHESYSVQLIQSLFGLTVGEAQLTEALVNTGSLAAAFTYSDITLILASNISPSGSTALTVTPCQP